MKRLNDYFQKYGVLQVEFFLRHGEDRCMAILESEEEEDEELEVE